jgi:hypothetical protein
MVGLFRVRYEQNPYSSHRGPASPSASQFARLATRSPGSGKGIDVKAFKIAAFRDSMRRQYTSRTLQVEWPLGIMGGGSAQRAHVSVLPQ